MRSGLITVVLAELNSGSSDPGTSRAQVSVADLNN